MAGIREGPGGPGGRAALGHKWCRLRRVGKAGEVGRAEGKTTVGDQWAWRDRIMSYIKWVC